MGVFTFDGVIIVDCHHVRFHANNFTYERYQSASLLKVGDWSESN